MNKKIILGIATVMLTVTLIKGYDIYKIIYGKAVVKNGTLFIESTDNLLNVKTKLTQFINNTSSFEWIAEKKNYVKPKSGRYELKKGMSLNKLINLLRSGKQLPIKLSFNNQDTLEKLAGRVSKQIEADSISLLKSMKDIRFLKSNGFNKKSALGMYIPNSYELYWNTSAEKFRNRMYREYNRFWNEDRVSKARKLNLTKSEVLTLASIVQKETAQKSERPIVAGLYLNRLKSNMTLQADPTVIYCLKEINGPNFTVKRVLNKDLLIDSPYNTYKNSGLPPGVISMPDISAIDAVLNYKEHNFFYMCASIEKIGYHKFARTLSQHNKNALQYQQWINKRGINR